MNPVPDGVATSLAPDEGQRQSAAVFYGYVGKTSDQNVFRLYGDDFKSWYELSSGDILAQLQGTEPSGRSYVWVSDKAMITHSRVGEACDFAREEAEALDEPGGTRYPRK